jgi:galactokinase
VTEAGFISSYGREPEGVWFAPGRVNLMGGPDYTELFVLPFALSNGLPWLRPAAPVPLDPAAAGLALLVIDTRARRALTDGRCARQRSACERAARALGVPARRDIHDQDELERLQDPAPRRIAGHVLAEHQRLQKAVAHLHAGHPGALGPLLTESHHSMRDNFGWSWPAPHYLDAVPSDGARRIPPTGELRSGQAAYARHRTGHHRRTRRVRDQHRTAPPHRHRPAVLEGQRALT